MSFDRLKAFDDEKNASFQRLENRFAVYEDSEILADFLADMISREVNTAGELNRPYHLAISGGSTPNLLIARLKKAELTGKMQPNQLHLWWVDERMVPSNDVQSNYGSVCTLWLEKSKLPLVRIHPIITEPKEKNLADSELADYCRDSYERELDKLELNAEGVPVFDLLLLGIGDDGHTASLFPNTRDENRWVQTSIHPESGQHRVGLGYPVLEHCENVCFLVSGAGKQDVLLRLLDKETQLPAGRVLQNNKTALVLTDQAAVKKQVRSK